MSQFGTDQSKVDAPKQSAAEIIYSHKEEILQRYLFRVNRDMQNARTEIKPVLINTLPNFLVNMAQALSPNDSRHFASDGSSVAQEHGGERARLTNYSPEDIIQEYQILRDCIFQVLKTKTSPDEEESGIIHASIDKAMTEAMNAYFLVLNRLRERVSLFLTNEIQKPLDSINGKALLIKRNPEKAEWVTSLSSKILTEVEIIHTMLHELNEPMPFKNSEKMRLKLSEGDLHTILERAIGKLNLRFGERFDYQGVSAIGFYHAGSIEKAIDSLCTALLNYNHKEKVTIRMEKVHGRAVITIHNETKHIPIGQQEILFQAFRRDQKGAKGNLGLPVARGVAEAHGGSVAVDSSREKGTTFLMDFLIDSRPYQPASVSPGSEVPGSHIKLAPEPEASQESDSH